MKFKQKPAYVALRGVFVIVVMLGMASISLAQVDTWTAKTPMPTVRTLSGACVIDGKIYVAGGAVNETNLTSAVEMYDPTGDTWTKKDTMPSVLCIHATCAFDGKMYVFGGISPTVQSTAKKSVYVYDPKMGTWTQKADMPYINAWCGIAVVDSTIYLIGGCTVAPGPPSQTVMAYNPYTQSWTSKANMPTARFGLSASVVNGKIYAIGGCNASYQSYNNVEVYDPSTNTWTRKSDMLTPRFGLGTCVVGGLIYAVGGCSALGACTDNEVYDPVADKWTTKSSMRQPRLGLFAGLVGGKIYAIGGSNPYPQPTMYGTVEEYDTGTGKGDPWTKKADMPTARYGLSTEVVNGKIYAIGGATSGMTTLSTVEVYDPASNTWMTKASMLTPRFFFSTSVVNGKIYAIGGAPAANQQVPTVEEYDPVTDTWTKKADMPTARHSLSGSVVDGKIYAIGGGRGGTWDVSTVEAYDPVSNTWATKASMSTVRGMLSTSVVDGKIYAIGGGSGPMDGAGISLVEEYNPASNTWTTKANMPTARKALSTSAAGGKIYAIGGTTGEQTANFSAVEVYSPAADFWIRIADMPTARSILSASAVNGKVYAIGGSLQGYPWVHCSTVEVYDPGVTGAAGSIGWTSGNNQLGVISTTLANAFVIIVTDAGVNPVSGVNVNFAITSVPSGATGQSLSTVATTTNSSGQASTVMTMGNKAGTYKVTAASSGLIGSPVTFTATGTHPAPTLSSISCKQAGRGSKINVTLTGLNFLQDVTTASFGADITVNSQTVVSATQIVVNITISGSAATGGRDVTVTNLHPGGGTATLTNGFTIDTSTPTSVESVVGAVPNEFVLCDAYPNPFNPSTNISFSVPSNSFVSLKVFDALGREVSNLVAEELAAGTYERQWNAANVPSGIYFYRLQAGEFVETKKMILLH